MSTPLRRLDVDTCWRDLVAQARAARDICLPVIGLFVFLPSVLVSILLPMQVVAEPTPEQLLAAFEAYIASSLHWLVLSGLAAAYAGAVVLAALVHDDRPTLGEALARALPLAPALYLLTLIGNLLIGMGLALFVVPGLYLVGRFALAPVLLVQARRYNPLWALSRSWELTAGNGWRLAFLITAIFATGLIAGFALGAVAGALGGLGGGESARVASMTGSALVAAVAALAILLARASAWRQLAISGT